MKKLILLLCFGIISSIAGPHNEKVIYIEESPVFRPLDALWDASVYVESSDNDNALNRLEGAFGCVQIRMIRLRDYNMRTGKSYKLQDCYNRQISKEIWFYYATQFHHSNYESICKAWNGRGKSNRIYWAKIKKRLEIKNNYQNICFIQKSNLHLHH